MNSGSSNRQLRHHHHRIVAHRAAGHAVAAIVLGLPWATYRASVSGEPGDCEDSIMESLGDLHLDDPELGRKAIDLITGVMAGELAAGMAKGRPTDDPAPHAPGVSILDRLLIVATCTPIIGPGGVARFTRGEIDRNAAAIDALRQSATQRTRRLLGHHWGAVTKVAALIERHGSLSPDRVRAIVAKYAMPTAPAA